MAKPFTWDEAHKPWNLLRKMTFTCEPCLESRLNLRHPTHFIRDIMSPFHNHLLDRPRSSLSCGDGNKTRTTSFLFSIKVYTRSFTWAPQRNQPHEEGAQMGFRKLIRYICWPHMYRQPIMLVCAAEKEAVSFAHPIVIYSNSTRNQLEIVDASPLGNRLTNDNKLLSSSHCNHIDFCLLFFPLSSFGA